MTLQERLEKSGSLRGQGYNCAQCIMASFKDIHNLDERDSLLTAIGLGGGVGGTGHICGVLSAIAATEGHRSQGLPSDKKEVYKCVSEITRRFEERYGSSICRELKRPGAPVSCNDLIRGGIEIYDQFLRERNE